MTAPAASSSRARVLHALRDATRPMRVDELCAVLELSRNAVRFHLGHLLESGEIRHERFAPSGPGRPSIGFRAVPREAVDDAAAYLALATLLGRALTRVGSPAAAEEAGEAWAAQLVATPSTDPDPDRAVQRLVGVLDEYGFAPCVSGRTVELHRCPYVEVALEQPEVVCGLHLGLVRGLLGAAAPGLHLRLTPVLDGSGPCLLHLDPVTGPGETLKEPVS